MRVQRTIDATGYRGQRIVLTTRLRTGAQGQAEVAVIDEDARARASDWSGAQRGALRRPAQATESLVLDVAASARGICESVISWDVTSSACGS